MERLRRLLGVMPAVYLQGARQTGKTTLAEQLLEAGVLRDYVSFDDPLVRTAASGSGKHAPAVMLTPQKRMRRLPRS